MPPTPPLHNAHRTSLPHSQASRFQSPPPQIMSGTSCSPATPRPPLPPHPVPPAKAALWNKCRHNQKPTLDAHNTQARKPSRAWPARLSSRASESSSAWISMVRVCVCLASQGDIHTHLLPSSQACRVSYHPSFPRAQCPSTRNPRSQTTPAFAPPSPPSSSSWYVPFGKLFYLPSADRKAAVPTAPPLFFPATQCYICVLLNPHT